MTTFNAPTSANTQTMARMLTESVAYTTEATQAAAAYHRAQRLSGLVVTFKRTEALIHDVLVDQTLDIPDKNRRDLNAVLEMMRGTDCGSAVAGLSATLARRLSTAHNALRSLRKQSGVVGLPAKLTRRIDTAVCTGR